MSINLNIRAQRTSRNLLKNPAFSVIQSRASGTIPNSLALPTASLGYSGETEWCLAATGGTPAYAFSAIDESLTITGASGITAMYLLQRIESRDTNRIKGKTVTFSVELSNSLLTSVIWEVFRPTTLADQHGTIASPTQTLIASGTFTVSSTLTRYTATFALPAEAALGLEVRLGVGAQTSGTWVVARPQLEEGAVATSFNCGDYLRELQKCLRYAYCINASASTQIFITGMAITSGASILSFVPMPENLFAAPILVISAANNFSFGGITGTPTAFSIVSASPNNRNILLTTSGSFTGTAVNLRLEAGAGFMRFLSHIP